MRTLLKYVLPVLFAALLSGCGASLARKVRIGEEVAVRQYGTVGLDLTFDVENASRRTLRLEEAELEFFTGAGSLGRAVLRGSVEVPGRSRGPVCSRWKFDFPDAAAGMVLRKRLEEGDYARLEVEVRMTLRAGAVRRRVSFERMPFSEFLNNSGKLLFVPYTKDFGRITQFWGNDLATVLYATFCSDMLSSHSFSKQR